MNIKQHNNLLELFYNQFIKEKSDQIFLQSLKDPKQQFTWNDTYHNILKLSDILELMMQNNDRCLLISENRPEWMISDLAIMLAKGITVPAYITYTERDYDYLIEDCKPSVIIISDETQYNKIKNIIKTKSFIKGVISFEDFHNESNIVCIKNIFNNEKFKKKIY